MTRYAVDEARHALVGSWSTGSGDIAVTVAVLPPSVSAEQALLALIAAIRATPLDPARPALDLLEDLLSGIRGCWLVFTEYARVPPSGDEEDDELPEDSDDNDASDDEAITEEFISLVRAAAAEEHDQLL
jgi:hypothetical protein